MKENNTKFNNSRGIAFVLTLIIMTGLLALALGITALLIREIKLSQEIADSVVAYGAADAGIERFMYGVNKESLDPSLCVCGVSNCYSANLSNNTSYVVCTKQATPPIEIKSTGTFGSTNRSIQITY